MAGTRDGPTRSPGRGPTRPCAANRLPCDLPSNWCADPDRRTSSWKRSPPRARARAPRFLAPSIAIESSITSRTRGPRNWPGPATARTVTRRLVREVLAPLCDLSPDDAEIGFERLRAEGWIVEDLGHALHHRRDLRARTLPLMRATGRDTFETVVQKPDRVFRQRPRSRSGRSRLLPAASGRPADFGPRLAGLQPDRTRQCDRRFRTGLSGPSAYRAGECDTTGGARDAARPAPEPDLAPCGPRLHQPVLSR